MTKKTFCTKHLTILYKNIDMQPSLLSGGQNYFSWYTQLHFRIIQPPLFASQVAATPQ